jgi:hypothetical protein
VVVREQRENQKVGYRGHRRRSSDVAVLNAILNIHVLELARLEDLAAFLAFHKFRLFVAAHDLHTWVSARLFSAYIRRRDRRLGGHVIRIGPKVLMGSRGVFAPEFLGIVERLGALSSPLPVLCWEFVTKRIHRWLLPSPNSDPFRRIAIKPFN